MKIELDNWEEDALEGRLDRLGMAFIEFNEFNEFCMGYDISFGEKLLENDLEDQLEAKINLSYKDYKVTRDDFFQGCPTMLNNEKAAIAKVRQIYKDLKAKKQENYIDPDFGPPLDKPNDFKLHDSCLYKNGVLPQKGYIESKDIEWVFAEALCDPGEKP